MAKHPAPYWHDMTSEDFVGLDPERTVAVLPVAAVEQHGPHLPVQVDSCINAGIIARMVEMLPEDLPVTVLPQQAVGKSNEHLRFPGTLTLSAETLMRVLTELGECVHRAGLRKLVLFNSHGGNVQVLEIVARELRVRHDMMVTALAWPALGKPEGLYPEEEGLYGIHAGANETALMLHLRPDLVKMEKAQDFRTLMQDIRDEQYRDLTILGRISVGWMAQDVNPHGAAGNATLARAQDGKALADHAASRFIDLLREISRYPLSNLKAGPR
jgi:creatinine amidohydrolase